MQLLTCALATGISYSIACNLLEPNILSGRVLLGEAWIFAPIKVRGVIILCIGRRDNDSSPIISESKSWFTKIPVINLAVVPELLAYNGDIGFLRFLYPDPFTIKTSLRFSKLTPIEEKQLIVDFTSSPFPRL